MPHSNQSVAPIYLSLRKKIITLKPAKAGIFPMPEAPNVWGLLMETGYPNGIATLVMLADGTTSLYFSTGGGYLGGGGQPAVANATRACIAVAERLLDAMAQTQSFPLPVNGQVIFHALTYRGPSAAQFTESELGQGNHPFSGLFYAAHAVITQVRQLQEQRQAG